VGPVQTRLQADASIEIENVPSFRAARELGIDVPGIGRVTGDLAWGGNWFFLIDRASDRLDRQPQPMLTVATSCCVPGGPTMDRRAPPERARNSPVLPPRRSWPKTIFGSSKTSSAALSAHAIAGLIAQTDVLCPILPGAPMSQEKPG
jgi:hypothetical protein